MDLFVVPTLGFDLLYAFVIVRLDRRELVWINVTANPTAEWVARQITEAFPWNEAPRYLIRDRDSVYDATVTRRLRAMGIRDKPIAPASPCQNSYAERLIESIRRELCVPKTSSVLIWRQNRITIGAMVALLFLFLNLLTSPFKSTSRLEAENAALRHQLVVLERNSGGRLALTNGDRMFFVLLYRWFPSILQSMTVVRPETVVR